MEVRKPGLPRRLKFCVVQPANTPGKNRRPGRKEAAPSARVACQRAGATQHLRTLSQTEIVCSSTSVDLHYFPINHKLCIFNKEDGRGAGT